MKAEKISYKSTGFFSKLVIDYLAKDEKLLPFIQAYPSKEHLAEQILLKQQSPIDRPLLHQILTEQYQGLNHNQANANIELLLDENTLSICTAHQPNIFTGPLYIIYKIIHAIKLAEECSLLFPNYRFVPIYYMGSEDHDLDEIGTFNFNDKKYSWQTSQKGSCGEMHTHELLEILNEIKQSFNMQIEDENRIMKIFEEAYGQHHTLAAATRFIMNELFGEYGLIVFDANNMQAKKAFSNVMQEELLEQKSYHIVKASIALLPAEYTAQANPREINLFYKNNNAFRERIEWKDNQYHVINTDIHFTKTEILQELALHPENFSPNVILRPLLQEFLLPNIAFIGGGGELAYWIQYKNLFEHFKVPFPMLFLRNSVLWIDKKSNRNKDKIQLSIEDIFINKDVLIKRKLSQTDEWNSLKKSEVEIKNSFLDIEKLASSISPNLKKSMQAHLAKQNNLLERVNQKFMSHIKRNEVDTIQALDQIKSNLFPNNSLQERHDNYLTLYKRIGQDPISLLMKFQNPLSTEFLVLMEE